MAPYASPRGRRTAPSVVHRLDPRVKIVGTVAYMASCLLVRGPATCALAAACALAAIALARIPRRQLARQMRPLAVFVAVTALVNLLAADGGAVVASWGPWAIREGGVEAAAMYTVRFLLLLLGGAVLVLTTAPSALAAGLEDLLSPLERIGVPVGRAALVVSIALRFVPALARDAEAVVSAQTARGADFEGRGPLAYARACIPLAVPLFASALRRADVLGRAIDARGYTGTGPRTRFRELRFHARRDGTAALLVAAYLVAFAALSL